MADPRPPFDNVPFGVLNWMGWVVRGHKGKGVDVQVWPNDHTGDWRGLGVDETRSFQIWRGGAYPPPSADKVWHYTFDEYEAFEKKYLSERNGTMASTTQKTDKPTLAATLAADATDAAWRTAGSQFVKLAREPLVGLLSRHLAPEDEAMRGRIAAFLQTELGSAMLAGLLSLGLGLVPGSAAPVAERMSRELRVAGMAKAGDTVADLLTGPLLEVARLYLQDGEGAPAIRVAVAEPQAAAEVVEPELVAVETKAQAKAR